MIAASLTFGYEVKRSMFRLALLCATPLAAGFLSACGSHSTWEESVLHSFSYCHYPRAGLIADASGTLYGTTGGGGTHDMGTVFKLTPPVLGQTAWTGSVLHSFAGGADGSNPSAGLIADASGVLYGTTGGGGTHDMGTVFKLTPPASGQTAWTESVLYAFTVAHGRDPFASLTADATGALYGTTSDGGLKCHRVGCGTVFKLTPPASGQIAWTESVLHSFTGGTDGRDPEASLIADVRGALYGTTDDAGSPNCHGGGCGTVFKLTPPAPGQTAWTKSVLHSFTGGADGREPEAGLMADASGALYGTTRAGGAYDHGTVFKVTPPAPSQNAWTESVLHAFTGADGGSPEGAIIADTHGALYGTTASGGAHSYGGGTVFKLTPPASGATAWTESVLHFFDGGGAGGSEPGHVGLIADARGALYGTTAYGGALRYGTVFKLSQ
jgi:uncharacterized repeat protein (TIGR03803 family)